MLFWVLPIAQVDVPLGIASIIPGPSWGTSSEGGSVLSVSEMDSSGRISSAGGSSGADSSVGVVSSVVGGAVSSVTSVGISAPGVSTSAADTPGTRPMQSTSTRRKEMILRRWFMV